MDLELVSSLQHWAKNMLEMFSIQHTSIWPSYILIVLRTQKNKHKCNFHYVAMPMMTLQILKSMDFIETQKSRHLENKTFFFSNKKIHYCISSNNRQASNKHHTFGYTHWNKCLPLISTSPLVSTTPLNVTSS